MVLPASANETKALVAIASAFVICLSQLYFVLLRITLYYYTMVRDSYKDICRKIREHADLSGKRILEVGCGSGNITQMYMNDPQLIVGIEPDSDAVRNGAKTVPNASFVCGSGMSLPFASDSFDVVLFTLSLHHHWDSLAALAEARRVLTGDGLILVIEPTPESEIQKFCKPFEDEDHKLIAVENALTRCPLETVSKETFQTHWEFTDFADATNHTFTYYNHPPDEDKRNALLNLLGPKAHEAPIRMLDTLRLTTLRPPR